MTAFRDREQAFEIQYAHDEELRFKTRARRNKLIGLWAAEKMGLKGEAASEYARTVVFADFKLKGDEALSKKIAGDLGDRGVRVCESEVLEQMAPMMALASQQVRAEG